MEEEVGREGVGRGRVASWGTGWGGREGRRGWGGVGLLYEGRGGESGREEENLGRRCGGRDGEGLGAERGIGGHRVQGVRWGEGYGGGGGGMFI
jgi:hypothetical protein